MALPTKTELKLRLRIQSVSQDTLLDQLLAQAQATLEHELGIPLVAVARTQTDRAETSVPYGEVRALMFPLYPLKLSVPAPVIDDYDGDAVDATTYTVDGTAGIVRAKRGVAFANGPYTLTAHVGLDAHPDYATRLEAFAGGIILDLAQDLYQRRNPSAQAEGSGGGVYTQWQSAGVPPRVREAIALLRPIVGVG